MSSFSIRDHRAAAVRLLFICLLVARAGSASAQWLPAPWVSGPTYFTGGNVGIGASDPTLQNGDTGLVITGEMPSLRMFSTALASGGPVHPPTCGDYELGTTLDGFQIFDGCALAIRLRIDPTGKVIVGDMAAGSVSADSVGADSLTAQAFTLKTSNAVLSVFDSRAYATGVGGQIAFGGYTTSNYPEPAEFSATIAGIKENSTANDASSALLFSTYKQGAGMAERMRIASDGLVTIGAAGGTTTKLTVNGLIQSSGGGFKFPDGTIQTTAATSGGATSPWTAGTGGIFYSSGNVGIGTNAPQSAFHISRAVTGATDYLLRVDNGSSTNNPGTLVTYTGGKSLLSAAGTNGATLATNGSLGFATGSDLNLNNPSNVRMSINSTGNVAIGPLAASHTLDVSGTPVSNGGASEILGVFDTRSFAAGVGGGIVLGGKYNTAGTVAQSFASIQGIKENATDGDYASAMTFFTRQNGSTPAEQMRIASDGLVTIGAAGGTTTKLTVNGMVQSSGGGFKFPDGTIQTTAATGGGGSSQWATGTPSGAIYYSGGNVGIGTSSTTQRLTVAGGHIALDNGWQLLGRSSAASYYYRLIGNDSAERILIGDTTSSIGNEIRFHSNGSTIPTALIATNGNVGIGVGATAPAALLEVSKASSDATAKQEVARFSRTGGSSTSATPARSTLISFYDASNPTLTGAMGGYRTNASNDYNGGLQFYVNNTGATAAANVSQLTEAMRIDNAGHVGIGKSNPNKALDVVGDIYASGNISGGTVFATYQDVAEWVPASGTLPPGTVVILNRTKTNEVTPSTRAYDTAVAGVVSEKPGLLLGKGTANDAKIATTGRVKVRVDASKHPIAIGDLLVTSDEAGTAMFSEPLDVGGIKIHRPGTIIGKALESLDRGTGEILVLLSLQ